MLEEVSNIEEFIHKILRNFVEHKLAWFKKIYFNLLNK